MVLGYVMARKKQNVELCFDSLLNLWCFKKKAALNAAIVRSTTNSLTAELSNEQVTLAVRQYNARVIAQVNTHPL